MFVKSFMSCHISLSFFMSRALRCRSTSMSYVKPFKGKSENNILFKDSVLLNKKLSYVEKLCFRYKYEFRMNTKTKSICLNRARSLSHS